MVDVTSMCRPDTEWLFVDVKGHDHVWCSHDGARATSYRPDEKYSVPTARPFDVGVDEDGFPLTELRCRMCGERVCPGTTADVFSQYIGGIKTCWINGEQVDRETFKRELFRSQSIR